MIKSIESELYFRSEATLAEAPVWDSETLYWTDITGKALYAKPDTSDQVQKHAIALEVGAFALWDDHRMVLATEQGFQSFDTRTSELKPLVDPEENIPDNRFNDGKCDPAGRFVAGTMSRKREPGKSALYLLDHDFSARKIYSPVTTSNGLAWSATGETLYYIDTPLRVVRAFDYDLERGALSRERVVVEIPTERGKPDGMTIDREGNLWIALWGGGAVECWNPNTGKCLARIALPASRPSSCIFGGPKLDTLYITTARSGLEPHELAQQELAGSIFCANPGISGRLAVRFRKAQP